MVDAGLRGAEGVLMSYMVVAVRPCRPSHPYYTGTEHLDFSPTRQRFLHGGGRGGGSVICVAWWLYASYVVDADLML